MGSITGAVAARVVLVAGDVLLRVGNRGNQAHGVVGELGDVIERVGDLSQLAVGGVLELGNAGRGIAAGLRSRDREQVSVGVVGIGGDVAQGVGHGQHFAEAVVGVGGRLRGAGVERLRDRRHVVAGVVGIRSRVVEIVSVGEEIAVEIRDIRGVAADGASAAARPLRRRGNPIAALDGKAVVGLVAEGVGELSYLVDGEP